MMYLEFDVTKPQFEYWGSDPSNIDSKELVISVSEPWNIRKKEGQQSCCVAIVTKTYTQFHVNEYHYRNKGAG